MIIRAFGFQLENKVLRTQLLLKKKQLTVAFKLSGA